MKPLLLLATIVCFFAFSGDTQAEEALNTKSLLQKYCVRCHNTDEREGDVSLDQLSRDDIDLFGQIYEQLSSRQMPPDDEMQPTSKERERLARLFLELAKKSTVPETAALRRLNKREYSNTVRDLLGIRGGIFDPGKFIYKDEVSEGFDTEGESLVTSNELLLEYLEAAQLSLRQALFTLDPEAPKANVINVDTAKMTGASRRYETKDRQAYVFRVGKAKIHGTGPTQLMKMPGRYRITVTASAIDQDRYPVPFVPVNAPPVLGIGIVSGNRSGVSEFDRHEEKFPLKYDQEQTFQLERWIDQGFHPYLQFANGPGKPVTQIRANLRRGKITKADATGPFVGPGIRVTEFKIEGPFYDTWPPESVCTTIGSNTIPDFENATARLYLLGRFAKRTFRRRVTREEMTLWVKYLNARYATTRDWREAFIETMTAMMASPDFLYLQENEGELGPFQLASRLSYFFWSTMPDHELFSLADSGKLTEPDVLRQQVIRLIQDPRSRRFSDSFVDQWLALDTLGSMPPDSKLFRFYNASVETAMLAETRQFFRHVFQENRSVRDFIDSEYTFLNRQLATLYGIPIEGGDNAISDGKLVLTRLPKGSPRGGILGHASVLTLTSNGVETSPVTRGVWVLANFMGTPPPPPPAEVPALVPDLNGARTVRQMLEKHRSDPACMSCHRRMDPLGFALEAFDPVGRFRTNYSKRVKVSTQGRYMGQNFDDINELKQILSSDLRLFARNLIVRLSEYAKGRKLVSADYATVEAILSASQKDGFNLKHIVYMIAISDLMTHR
ncbi:DUF1592 domain-containing protein [Aporhodopirellula aestuarii]|uniref:DUF1592 domain-containing protein n=1 Tax=Aporhodopirellula aestuarii TaxID=2950107 RepID=A0ABT0U435_9BACT|nr:DUF1592 domain-containing protein [Aporhodopirellula aestuarii]MCM2371198.1 DUF1592 domain-containing protein [Aporhodopirellula aestuarii]